ncbi:CGNR zinc finger domain-containing protein [Microbaculum marinum]|uniref:CGNR zinc finger domain-containing protein n=1 Tax=Microbaculum marinum TaxID=1764581 RepID=A0AAW9RR72_9HYPH
MPFAWTERQFVGGALCLDFANTVYYADDAARRGDRLRDGADIAAWLAAAIRFDAATCYIPLITVPDCSFDTPAVLDMLALRQSIDELFRTAASGMAPPSLAFRPLLYALGNAMSEVAVDIGADGLVPKIAPAAGASPATARAALAHSGLALAQSPVIAQVKSCPNCNWLFVDRSRNASRVWCDMLTCGNRAKARRHQIRKRPNLTIVPDFDG